MIDKKYSYALVGASSNSEKYGYKVFENLLNKGYTIIPIHPKGGELLGEKVYPKISDVDTSIDVVIFVTPPEVSLEVLKDVEKNGIAKVWFQPGASDFACIAFCKDHNIQEVHEACMMVQG